LTKPKKAVAPRPLPEGAEAEAAAVDISKEILEITFRGETHTLAWRAVPMDEKLQVRAQARVTFDDVVGLTGIDAGIDTVCVLVWLAKRASGQPKLTWAYHALTWPKDLTMVEVDSRVYQADSAEADLSDPQS
jgi:hypothetical protein